jgi:hypothetical protein
MYWGHKAGILGLSRQGVPLDAVAVADGVCSLLLMKLAYQNAEFESRLFVRTSSRKQHREGLYELYHFLLEIMPSKPYKNRIPGGL